MLDEEIGAFGFGEAEAELENIASAPVPHWMANQYRIAWACMFETAGASVVYRRNVEGSAPVRINTKAFFRHLLDKEMVGGVQASDVGILIQPDPLKTQGLAWPPLQGDMIVRRSGKDEETLFTALATPQIVDVGDVYIVIRMIGRMGAAGV